MERDLSLILWRERELLETLLFKLEMEQLVLASGHTRWLALRSARGRDRCSRTIRETELLRAVAVDEAAAEVGLAPNPSLQVLAQSRDEPWRSILLDHREAFVESPARSPRCRRPTASCSPPATRPRASCSCR